MMKKRFKQGAASFYVIAFSTLVLMIVVASFTALVIAQITRSSNDDLAQSAYDSALAGVEDAKLAFYNYQACLAQGVKAGTKPNNPYASGAQMTCENIVWLMENSNEVGYATLTDAGINPCDVVPLILGRTIVKDGDDVVGVAIKEGNNDNNMQQYYTCVKINTKLPDYRTTISATNPMKAIHPVFAGADAGDITKVKVSWGRKLDNDQKNRWGTGGFRDTGNGSANPPAIAFALAQASGKASASGEGFKMEDFMKIVNDGSTQKTNRGMLYLTPAWGTGDTRLGASFFVKSNSKIPTNQPRPVSCGDGSGKNGYECSVDLYLPDTIDGDGRRGVDNFIVAVMLAYGESTDINLEFYCEDGTPCGEETVDNEEDQNGGERRASLSGVQISVDSTGKANDLFRRVEARLEGSDSFAMSIMGPLELTGEDGNGYYANNDAALKKDLTVNCEYNFGSTTGGFCTNRTSTMESTE